MTTETPIFPSASRLELGTPLYCVGSCFAEHMGSRLRSYLFPAVINPYGVVYNPVACRPLLEPSWREPALFLHHGLWRSLAHHSNLAWATRSQALQLLANGERAKQHALTESRWMLLTLGTAQVFKVSCTGETVANCHRLPQSLFERRRMSPEECVDSLGAPLHAWLEEDCTRQVVLSVSPVRYLRDGLVENNRGKAALLLAADTLERSHSRIHYFPAYEIVLDELRDYRFFERDMAHPNALAVDIVWQRFAEMFLDEASLRAISEMDKLLAALAHRPGPTSDTKALGTRSLRRLETLHSRHPHLDVEEWREAFQMMLL